MCVWALFCSAFGRKDYQFTQWNAAGHIGFVLLSHLWLSQNLSRCRMSVASSWHFLIYNWFKKLCSFPFRSCDQDLSGSFRCFLLGSIVPLWRISTPQTTTVKMLMIHWTRGRMSLARVHKWLGHRKETCAFQVWGKVRAIDGLEMTWRLLYSVNTKICSTFLSHAARVCKGMNRYEDGRKFRGQTSDFGQMQQQLCEQWKSQRRESVERRSNCAKRWKSRETLSFSNVLWLWSLEGLTIGLLKRRRVRSHLAGWEIKNCTLSWRKADLEVKMLKTPRVRSAFGSWVPQKMHAAAARSQNSKSITCSQKFWKLRGWKSAGRCGAKHYYSARARPFLYSLSLVATQCSVYLHDCTDAGSSQPWFHGPFICNYLFLASLHS